MKLTTKVHPTDFFEASSSLQKAIRRGLEEDALYWAAELDLSGYGEYVWKRLRIMTSEDVGLANPLLPATIAGLYATWKEIRAKKDEKRNPEKLFLAHAVILLVRSPKSRLVDWLAVAHWRGHDSFRRQPLDEAVDKHTRRGKAMGRGWDHFFAVGGHLENFAPLPGEAEAMGIARKILESGPTMDQTGQITIDSLAAD
jgi:replication-associated recombination protein RarA